MLWSIFRQLLSALGDDYPCRSQGRSDADSTYPYFPFIAAILRQISHRERRISSTKSAGQFRPTRARQFGSTRACQFGPARACQFRSTTWPGNSVALLTRRHCGEFIFFDRRSTVAEFALRCNCRSRFSLQPYRYIRVMPRICQLFTLFFRNMGIWVTHCQL